MHQWGDEWDKKNGKDLNNAITYCMDTWKRYGRIGSHGKEKYLVFRHHCYFWDGGVWSLFYPGYVWVKPGFWSFIYYTIDFNFTMAFTKYTGLQRLGVWYQRQVYNYAIQRACKKYPNIIDELVRDSEVPEFITPGVFGPVDGMTIHNKYWTRCD